MTDEEKIKVIVIDDEKTIRDFITSELKKFGFQVKSTESGKRGISLIKKEPFDIVICDRIISDIEGLSLIKTIKSLKPHTEIIVVTGYGTIDSAVECIRNGAYDYIVKPIEINHLVLTIQKVYEKLKLKKELNKTQKQLEITNDDLKHTQQQLINSEKLSIVSKLAASIAHQLRNPLSIITSSSQFLLKKLSPKGLLKERLETIERNSKHAEEIIKEVLSVARPSEVNKFSPIFINKILDDAVLSVSSKFNDSNITIKKKYGELPVINGSQHHIEQAFLNFIMNAFDAMQEGGNLTIEAKKTNNEIEVVFTDTGSGMTPDSLSKLFQPFFTTKRNGIGLGMFAAKKIIETHNGNISVKSIEKKGTTIIVKLPISK